MKRILRIMSGACLLATAACGLASDSAVEKLREAMLHKDFAAFNAVLESDAIRASDFYEDPMLYDMFCASTYHTYKIFFERILAFGVDPSGQNPDPEATARRYPLSCAATRSNLEAFTALLDAGAESELYLCSRCAPGLEQPLVDRLLRQPKLFNEVIARRELADLEMRKIARSVEKAFFSGTWQGKPVVDFYVDYLRERGYNVTPRDPADR